MANHIARGTHPQQKPEAEAPPVRWLTLVQVAEDDYRVLTLVTKGIPQNAARGEESTTQDEGEERFKAAAADLFDGLDSLEGETFLPPHRIEQTCHRCSVTFLLPKPGPCPRCQAWDKAIDACADKLKHANLLQELKVQR